MQRPALSILAVLTLSLASCLETEEEITVHSDGSVVVSVRARGDAHDLANGYALPLQGPWIGTGPGSQQWIENFGPDTGSAGLVERVAAVEHSLWGDDADEVELRSRAVFASVAKLPTSFVPEDAAYAAAYTQWDTTHEVRELGDRRVHVFERRYRARDHKRFDPWEQMHDHMSEGLKAALEENGLEALPEWWLEALELMRAHMIQAADDLTRDALLSIFTEGDASLSAIDIDTVAGVARVRTSDILTEATLMDVRRFFESNGDSGLNPDVLEDRVRDIVRNTLSEELPKLLVEERVINAVLAHLELRFTAMNHDGDLGDDAFRVLVSLPGNIVGGNYKGVDLKGRAVFEFEGKQLVDGALTLRAVSVEY